MPIPKVYSKLAKLPNQGNDTDPFHHIPASALPVDIASIEPTFVQYQPPVYRVNSTLPFNCLYNTIPSIPHSTPNQAGVAEHCTVLSLLKIADPTVKHNWNIIALLWRGNTTVL